MPKVHNRKVPVFAYPCIGIVVETDSNKNVLDVEFTRFENKSVTQLLPYADNTVAICIGENRNTTYHSIEEIIQEWLKMKVQQ